MTEFNLTNGQAIELTAFVKDDKHATIDDKPVKTKISINTTLIKQVIDNLLKEIEEAKFQNVPHVRIEFDHINDVPTIFIDGEKVQDGLVSLNVDWKTNTEKISEKTFELKTINKDGFITIFGEGSLF